MTSPLPNGIVKLLTKEISRLRTIQRTLWHKVGEFLKIFEEALKLYQKSAAQDYAPAQCCLADCYRLGTGVPVDFGEAVKWYQKAAEQGYAPAQNYLGIHYGLGEGIPQDKIQAYMWLSISEKAGNAEATRNRETLAASMTKEERIRALLLAGQWQPRKPHPSGP